MLGVTVASKEMAGVAKRVLAADGGWQLSAQGCVARGSRR